MRSRLIVLRVILESRHMSCCVDSKASSVRLLEATLKHILIHCLILIGSWYLIGAEARCWNGAFVAFQMIFLPIGINSKVGL